MLTRSNLPNVISRFMGYKNAIVFVGCKAGRKFAYIEVARIGSTNSYVVWLDLSGGGNISLLENDETVSAPTELRYSNVYQLVRLLRSKRIAEHMRYQKPDQSLQ